MGHIFSNIQEVNINISLWRPRIQFQGSLHRICGGQLPLGAA